MLEPNRNMFLIEDFLLPFIKDIHTWQARGLHSLFDMKIYTLGRTGSALPGRKRCQTMHRLRARVRNEEDEQDLYPPRRVKRPVRFEEWEPAFVVPS